MKIRNVIFYTNSIDTAKKFYKDLGFELVEDFGKFISFDTGVSDVLFSVNVADDSSKVPGKQTCIFCSKDIEADFKRIKDLEVTFVKELYEAPFGKTFSFRDPDGNKIELLEEK